MPMDDLARYLEPDPFVDADHPEVRRYAMEHGGDTIDGPRAVAVRLYYAIRDGFRYNPWNVELGVEGFRASNFLERGKRGGGHCIDKALLLAACARARGIPARLHFANVRNHIGTEELERILGTDLLVFHGYTELWLERRWVAATPAFNRELCEHLDVAPLEFDGCEDSIFQQYDNAGGQFMEYVHDYGAFDTIPYELMLGEWRKHYRVFRETNVWPSRHA
jgi:transglutaminase-like putative cysteine protease